MRRLVGRLLGPPPLDRLAAVHAFSTAADACITVSLAGSLFFSVSVDAARPRLLLYLVLTLAPFAVVTPFLGPIVERFGGTRPAVVAFAGQARAVLSLFIAVDLRNLLLYPESFGVLVLGKAYSVVKSSLVPTLVHDHDELVAANSHLSRIGAITALAGGGLGGVVLALVGPTSVLRVAAVLHLAGAALALRIPARVPAEAPVAVAAPEAEAEPAPVVREPEVAVVGMAMLRAAVGFVTFVVAFALKREGAPALFFGGVAVAAAVGNFLGTLVSPALRRHWLREQPLLAGALVLAGAGAAVAGVREGRLGYLIVAFVVALAANIGRQGFDSLLQRTTTDAVRPRAFARNEARFQLAWVAGALLPTGIDLGAGGGLVALGAVLAIVGTATFVARSPVPVGETAVSRPR